MQLSNTPGKLLLPFAADGTKNAIPVDSQIGIVAGKASLADGFPPLTRTPLSAGGVPPSGLDMNGILFEMSDVIRWANAGGGYAYDAAFATDTNVGGYPKGARVMRSDGLGYWFNTVDNNETDPEVAGAAAAGWVPDFTSGATAIAMTNANVTLTPPQYGKPTIVISGILTTNLNLIFPSIAGHWNIINNTTGNFTITAKTLAGTGVAVIPGFIGSIFGDGVNISGRLADVSGPLGDTLVGHTGSGSVVTTVAAQLQLLSRVTVYLKSTNTAAQNKAAFLTAIASLTRPSKLLLPDGFYECAPGIDLGTLVVSIEGGGKYGTYLSNSAATAATYFFGVADATLMEYLRFSEFGIDCGGAVLHGFRLAKCNHSKFGELLVTGASASAMYIGGYSNDFVENDIFVNAGSGMYLTGTLNNVDVTRNRIYANDGIGIILGSTDADAGLSISIHDGNAIEANKIAGIIAFNTKGLNIRGNYFERNGATGYPYSVPESIVIRADIHLLSADDFRIGNNDTYSNKSPIISGNQAAAIGVGTALPNMDGFIFTSHADNLRVENNEMFDATKINALVSCYANRTYSKITGGMSLSGNTTDSVGYIGTVSAATQCLATQHFVDNQELPEIVNYAEPNFLAWIIFDGTAGTLVRASNAYLGLPVFQLTDGDFQWGFGVDTNINPELLGKWVYFGMWVNTQGGNTNARLFISGNSSSGATDFDATSTWKFKSTLLQISNTPGVTYFGVKKVGTGVPVLLCNPVVSVVGGAYNQHRPQVPVWKRGAAPTTGTWKLGDRVFNVTPAVGQPKSWICTVAGTPGTWVSEGNL